MEGETRRERFLRIGESRVTKCIKSIRMIGNLSNKGNYDYQKKDVDLIIRALNDEIRSLKSRFYDDEKSNDPVFKFQK